MAIGTKPVKIFRHRGISASVFANSRTDGGKFHKVNLQRAYKKDDRFEHNASFGRDEIPIARMLLQKAWEFVLEQEAAGNGIEEAPDGA